MARQIGHNAMQIKELNTNRSIRRAGSKLAALREAAAEFDEAILRL
jgi:hypothetical protein